MEDIEQAKNLLSEGKYKEAGALLDRALISGKVTDETWYLRGIVFLKMKNYDGAQECLENALVLGRKSKYYQIKGMAHFELFEMDEAIEAFRDALSIEPEDATTNFFLAVSYLFIDDGRSDEYIKKAYQLNSRKTSQLLMNFYTFFIKDDKKITESQKRLIEEKLKGLRT